MQSAVQQRVAFWEPRVLRLGFMVERAYVSEKQPLVSSHDLNADCRNSVATR